MNELEQIKSQLNEINNKRIKYQTLKEQAVKQCADIETKYGIKSLEELEALVMKAQAEYNASVKEAQKYIEETNKVFASYQGVLC
jgi:hypothetical protein